MKKSVGNSSQKTNKTIDNTIDAKMRLAIEWLTTQPENALTLVNDLLESNNQNLLLWVIATRANTRLGQYFQAGECVDKALKIDANHIEAIYAKSDLLYRSERLVEAEVYLKDAITRTTGGTSRPLRLLYATILQKTKQYEGAQRLYKQLTDEEPENWLSWNNLGLVSQELSRFSDMDDAYERSCALSKDNPQPFFNHIVGSHYSPQRSAEEILGLCKKWQKKFKPDMVNRADARNKAADKCLRIGLVSDGLRMHPVGQMIITGFEHIPASQIAFYAYSTNYHEDHLTHRLKRMCEKWMVIENVTNNDLDKIIRADEIDILFDLCGYNANSRMQAFQLAPAPLQIKWVGGLISSTGLETMDYLLSDSVETPEWADSLYTEKLIRMPDDYICYDPPFYLPAVNDNPFKKNGYITFGCFNNTAKINEVLLTQWAALMQSVPDSRLFLKSFNFDNRNLTEYVLTTLERHGITRERVRIEGESSHQALLACYNDVDIALDPWPYSGGLTTCEAMAMGVPVVTLPGPTFAGRHSASHLVNAGLQELVATDWQNYIDIAVGLARDVESLSIIRSNLRDIFLASPVCDGQRFARNFAEAMRAVWQRYCEGKAPAALTLNNDAAPYFEGDAEPMVLAMPTEVAPAQAKEPNQVFEFNLSGKIFMMDYGANLATSNKFITLAGLETFFFILMDTVGTIQEAHLPLRRKSIQHITLHALGNGESAPAWLCLDKTHSSNLKPLDRTRAQIITEVQTQSSRLDDIHGLDKLDWFVFDNRYDLKPVFEFGQRILSGCLVLEVRVCFNDTHDGQMPFDDIRRLLEASGFVFHRFNDIEYEQPFSLEGQELLKPTQMLAAKALFLPCSSRLTKLEIGQREKLAFILHVVYGLHDMALQVLQTYSMQRAELYINEVLPQYKSIPENVNQARKHSLPKRLVISLTSWHKRFNTLHMTLQCLLKQTIKADRVILWLAESECHLVPDNVLKLGAQGIDIKYCDDIKSYKKIIPTLVEEPDAFIVTADDDLSYAPDWLEKLVDAWDGNYKTVTAHRAHKIVLDKKNIPVPYEKWNWNYRDSSDLSYLIFPTTGFGTLYPPHCFHQDVGDRNIFEKLSLNADDVWLYWMCRLNDRKFRVVDVESQFLEWEGTSVNALWRNNLLNGDNDIYIKNMISHYGFIYD